MLVSPIYGDLGDGLLLLDPHYMQSYPTKFIWGSKVIKNQDLPWESEVKLPMAITWGHHTPTAPPKLEGRKGWTSKLDDV
jgi:hypothetical protein